MVKHLFWRILLCLVLVLSGPCVVTPAAARDAPSVVVPESLVKLEDALESVYTQLRPSVVNIRVVQAQEAMFPAIPEVPGFPFGPSTPQQPHKFSRQGSGSGFVRDARGHIVTNNHVIADADRISVTFSDGTTVAGTVVGSDPDADLVVLKVSMPASRLQPVQTRDSTTVKVGQVAIAIGNPFGLESTMTVGIVSGLGRLLPVETEEEEGPGYSIPDMIQTDAPINPGNSGGILVDVSGRVIGVTSAIISPVGASVGIGFAIPSVIVHKVVPALIKDGHYDHPWLGVSGQSLTPELAQAMGLQPDQRGALVVDVVSGSPADKAGLHGSDRQVSIDGEPVRVGGDVITEIDRQPIQSFDDLVTYLARSTVVGQTVYLGVLRHGKEQRLPVTMTARPKAQTSHSQLDRGVAGEAWLGIQGLTLTPEVANAMGLPADQQGVLIEQVIQGSPADKAGLRGSYKPAVVKGYRLLVGGDLIIAVGQQPITQISDLQAWVQQAQPGQTTTLTLLRTGKTVQVQVTLQARPATTP